MNRQQWMTAWRFVCQHWGEIQCGGLPVSRLQRRLLERIETTTTPTAESALPF